MSKSVTLLQLVYRTEPQFRQRLAAQSRFRHRHCRPPGLLHMLHPSVRHYAANRVGGSTGSGAERELKSKGLDNLHYSRRDTRSIRASYQPVSSAGRLGSDRDRRSQVCIEEGGRELQAKCRRTAKASRKEENPHAKLRFRRQCLIFQIPRSNKSQKSITKQVGIVPVVESEFQLIKIAVKMLHADLMIRADDRTLEQRPDAFHRVRVNVAAYPFLSGVIHGLMKRVRIAASLIRGAIIGHNSGCFIGDLRSDEGPQGFATGSQAAIESDLSAALDCAEYHSLAARSASLNLSRSNVLVHVLGFAANVCFVYFDKPTQKRCVSILDRFTDAMAEVPRCFVSNAKSALQLKGRHSLFGFANKIRCDEPLAERQVGIVKDRSGCNREMVAA